MRQDAPTRLDEEEYIATIKQVQLLASLVRDMPLKAAADNAQRALEIGPLLMPSEWIRGNQNCEDALALLRPLITFQTAVEELATRGPRR